MSVDDIAVQGAEPLFFLDYISIGKLVPEIVDDIVARRRRTAAVQAGCALLGGEMSEHPDLMEPGEFDLVGFAVGVVERGRDPARAACAPGDVVVGFASPGLRCNGYSLARQALLDRAGRRLDDPAWTGAHHSLGDELLRPSVIYAPAMREAARARRRCTRSRTSPAAGIPGNLARVLPDRTATRVVRRGTWDEPRIFAEIQAAGRRRRRRDGAGLQPRPRHAGRRRPRGPLRYPGCHACRRVTMRGWSERLSKGAGG